MTTQSAHGTNPNHGLPKRNRMVLLAALLTCCSWACSAQAYELMGSPGPYGLRSPTWSLGDITTITYSRNLPNVTTDLTSSQQWTAVQGAIQSTGALAYQVDLHARVYFPGYGTMDTTDVYTIPLFKFQEVPVGSGDTIKFAGWDDQVPASTIGYTDPTRTIHFANNSLHTQGYQWTANVPEGQYSPKIDAGSVAIHELGHALGLAHPNPAHPESIMSSGYKFNADRTWATDDLNGIADLYGPTPGVDYGTVVDSWHSIQDGMDWKDSVLSASGRFTSGYAKNWPGIKEDPLRSGYILNPSNNVLWSWDISWSLPSYGPQDSQNQDPVLAAAQMALAQDIWTGQNVFAPAIVPLPEPTTLLFLALGGLTLMRRRRAK
jgi:hypothetical protein